MVVHPGTCNHSYKRYDQTVIVQATHQIETVVKPLPICDKPE